MKSKVKAEIARMEKRGVFRKVEQPTDWCAGMVTVPKPNGKVRICVDLTKLNESVCRETYPLPKIDALLGEIGESTMFSKLLNRRQFRVLAGEVSREISTSHNFSNSFWQILLPTTPFWLEISTRTISEKNAY